MLDVHVVHKTSKDSFPSVMSEGLRYGEEGSNSRDDRVRAANEFLNAACPGELKAAGVDRVACIYCYLGVGDEIFDVESGRVVDRERWDVGADKVKVRLLIEAQKAFVGDLDAYDAVLDRMEPRAGDDVLEPLAREYWRRLVRLDDLRAHYRLDGDALVPAGTAPAGMPRRLERVEVLVTTSVPPGAIRQL